MSEFFCHPLVKDIALKSLNLFSQRFGVNTKTLLATRVDMKLPLQKDKTLPRFAPSAIPWISCQPFVENSNAVLIHRPRMVTTHKIGARWKSHIAITQWCGNSSTGTKKFTFLDAPPDGRLLCARCEEKAVAAGQQSASDITGKHIHLGGVVAVQLCCLDNAKQLIGG